jgi:hypothetical protein
MRGTVSRVIDEEFAGDRWAFGLISSMEKRESSQDL